MRQHIDMADIRLNLSQYHQLLGLHYEGTNTKDTIRCIKLIEKVYYIIDPVIIAYN